MILFIDLDGTLIHTEETKYKGIKDGEQDFVPAEIPTFDGAVDFIQALKRDGHRIIILSDSHPRYVPKIVDHYFQVEYLCLADKPNIAKTLTLIQADEELHNTYTSAKEQMMLIGDSILDIQLGRKLKISTAYIQLYSGGQYSDEDGIGDTRAAIKYGPTYIANNYEELLNIITYPKSNLLSLEAVCHGVKTNKAVKFWDYKDRTHQRIVAIRCLARQENGSSDMYSRADLYYQIDNPQRRLADLRKMAKGVENYLENLLSKNKFAWDYITYVSDKSSTIPHNKLKEIFDQIETCLPKIKLLEWNDGITTSLRNEKDYQARQSFIRSNLHVIENPGIVLERKNIIIIDDQLTTGATAFEIRKKLEEKNVGNILIITLFYMTLQVLDDKLCPKCGKPLVIKVNRRKGTKFYSCMPPQYGGNGCGYIENI